MAQAKARRVTPHSRATVSAAKAAKFWRKHPARVRRAIDDRERERLETRRALERERRQHQAIGRATRRLARAIVEGDAELKRLANLIRVRAGGTFYADAREEAVGGTD